MNKLFEFAVEWISAIKNKVEIIFSSKNHLNYDKKAMAIADKKTISVFCVSGIVYSPTQSAIQIE